MAGRLLDWRRSGSSSNTCSTLTGQVVRAWSTICCFRITFKPSADHVLRHGFVNGSATIFLSSVRLLEHSSRPHRFNSEGINPTMYYFTPMIESCLTDLVFATDRRPPACLSSTCRRTKAICAFVNFDRFLVLRMHLKCANHIRHCWNSLAMIVRKAGSRSVIMREMDIATSHDAGKTRGSSIVSLSLLPKIQCAAEIRQPGNERV